MKNEIEAMITDITTTTAEAEDYTGEDGLLYCGKCHTPKEAYFAEGKTCFGRDRHPTDCDCQRAAREKQQAAESRQKHLEKVEDLKRRGFTDPAMRNWTFEHDNGRNPQTETARFYVDSWETMQAENIGYLFWGGVGTGKSYLAACIANALMEKEVAVCMTNFATKATECPNDQNPCYGNSGKRRYPHLFPLLHHKCTVMLPDADHHRNPQRPHIVPEIFSVQHDARAMDLDSHDATLSHCSLNLHRYPQYMPFHPLSHHPR